LEDDIFVCMLGKSCKAAADREEDGLAPCQRQDSQGVRPARLPGLPQVCLPHAGQEHLPGGRGGGGGGNGEAILQ
jgi:hypothetical protein